MKQTIRSLLFFAFLLSFTGVTTGCSLLKNLLVDKKALARKKKEEAKAKKKAEDKAFFTKFIASSSCDNIAENAKRASKAVSVREYHKIGVRAAKCNHWKFLFENATLTNPRTVHTTFTKVESKGVNLLKGYGTWLAKQKTPYNGPYGEHQFMNLYDWMTKTNKNKSSNCSTMYAAVKRTKGDFGRGSKEYGRSTRFYHTRSQQALNKFIQRQMLFYMHKSGCKGSMDNFLINQLESNNWLDRQQACILLGLRKVKKAASQVQSIASSDGRFQIIRRVKVYPVRNACRSALGRIKRAR